MMLVCTCIVATSEQSKRNIPSFKANASALAVSASCSQRDLVPGPAAGRVNMYTHAPAGM